jgi:hypothetical protein
MIPPSVRLLGELAFFDCRELVLIVFQGTSQISVISKSAFEKTKIVEVIIPESVMELQERSFAQTYNLKAISFLRGSKLEKIESDVFSQTSLESLEIPAKVKLIGPNFFCAENLSKITVASPAYEIRDSLLVTADQKQILWAPRSIENVVVWPKVETIGDFAFYQCRRLRSITLNGNKLGSIGNYAFAFTAITSFIVPDSVARIGAGAFTNCRNLTDFRFGANSAVTEIGSNAFSLTSFEAIELPSKLTTIGDALFQNAKVARVGLPEPINVIRPLMFYGCNELEKVVMRGDKKVIIIRPTAFETANPVATLVVNREVTVIGVPPTPTGSPGGLKIDESAATNTINLLPVRFEMPTSVERLSDAVVDPEDFVQLNRLGRGRVGTVYQVQRKSTRLLCAMKELLRADSEDPNYFLQSIQREVVVLLKLKAHPAIIGLVGWVPPLGPSKVACIYMQYMENGSLSTGIHQMGASPTVKATWAVGLALGLRYLHHKEVVHRDIKPENVLLDEKNEVHIGDFGSAKNEATIVSLSRAAGTLWYVAPEFHGVGHTDYNFAVDVYSYAIVLWEIIKGEKPYSERKVTNPVQENAFLQGVREKHWRPNVTGWTGWIVRFLDELWDNSPTTRGTMDDVLDELAAHDYAILPGVDKAVVEAYRSRVEAAEAPLLGIE